jgi:hypothetical protein
VVPVRGGPTTKKVGSTVTIPRTGNSGARASKQV